MSSDKVLWTSSWKRGIQTEYQVPAGGECLGDFFGNDVLAGRGGLAAVAHEHVGLRRQGSQRHEHEQQSRRRSGRRGRSASWRGGPGRPAAGKTLSDEVPPRTGGRRSGGECGNCAPASGAGLGRANSANTLAVRSGSGSRSGLSGSQMALRLPASSPRLRSWPELSRTQPALRLSALGSRLSALGSRLSALGSRLSALGSRLSALGSRLSALGSRLSALGS